MGEVFLEATAGGAGIVASGILQSLVLEEELDTAAWLSGDLVPDAGEGSLVAALVFGAAVKVSLGEGTSEKRSVNLKIVETEDSLDEEGRWRFSFRAVDDLVKLKQKTQSRLLEVSPAAVIQQIASDHGFQAAVNGIEAYTQPILQNNDTDAALLRRLAGDYRYTVSLDGKTLRVGRALDTTAVAIGPGDGIGRLRVRRSLIDLPSKVDVYGYDWKSTQAAVQGTAAPTDLLATSGGKTGPALVKEVWGEVTAVVESERLLEQGDATALAKGVLQDRADRFVDGEVECLGQPDARPGRILKLEDLGAVTGSYRIRATRHSMDGVNGYRTTIWFYSDSLAAS